LQVPLKCTPRYTQSSSKGMSTHQTRGETWAYQHISAACGGHPHLESRCLHHPGVLASCQPHATLSCQSLHCNITQVLHQLMYNEHIGLSPGTASIAWSMYESFCHTAANMVCLIDTLLVHKSDFDQLQQQGTEVWVIWGRGRGGGAQRDAPAVHTWLSQGQQHAHSS